MYQYSFANVDLILRIPSASGVYKTRQIKGFQTGENLINVVRRAPIAATQFTAYGDMIVSLQRIKAGDLTFPVIQQAPENKDLQDYVNYVQAQADADGDKIYPIQGVIKDNMGNDEVKLINGIVLAIPGFTRGQTNSTITWVVTFEGTIFNRGNGEDGEELG